MTHIYRLGFFIFGLILLFLFFQACAYNPPLRGRAGLTTIHVTKPNFFQGLYLNTQNLADQMPACKYEIIGWDAMDNLYYKETCFDSSKKILGYVPPHLDNREATLQEIIKFNINTYEKSFVGRQPTGLISQPVSIFQLVEGDYSSIRLKIKSEGYQNKVGTWTAIVTQHIYGPQDVIIVGLG